MSIIHYDFLLKDIYDILDAVYESDYYNKVGPIETKACEDDGIEYYVTQFYIWCPQLNKTFRWGTGYDGDDAVCDVVAVYIGNNKDVADVEAIYSGGSVEDIIGTIAQNLGLDRDAVECVLEAENCS